MQAGLQSREPDHRDGFIHDLKAKVGDQAMQIELLEKKIEILEDGLRPPPRRPSQSWMIGSQATSPSAKKPYGILRVCRAWRLARATVQRHKALAEDAPRIPAKRSPKTFPSDGQILAEIRAVLASTLFVGEGHRKIWARLRQERGIRTSMRRVLRIMREHGILACDRPTGVRGPETHDRTITTETPDEMWAIDATGCLTDEGNAAVFVVIDHCTGECLGVRAARRGTRFEADG